MGPLLVAEKNESTRPRGAASRHGKSANWTKDRILKAILQREVSGRSLRTAAIKADDRPLFVAAVRHFGTWREVFRAAGIDPEAVSGRRIWSKERVVRTIRKIHRNGGMLNHNAIKKLDHSLIQAAYRHCGSWDKALQAAGFDPSAIRLGRDQWTKAEIIEAIKAHVASGSPLSKNAMRPYSIGIAAKRQFGSFDAALKVAGVMHLRTGYPRWSPAIVIRAIRRRQRAGQPVNCAAIIKANERLYGAGRRYFGDWNEAMAAAGLDVNQARAIRLPWTPEDVIHELRRRVAAGEPATCISSIRPISLVKACRKFFGSCEAAATAAGVDPDRIGYYWSPRNGMRKPNRGEAMSGRER